MTLQPRPEYPAGRRNGLTALDVAILVGAVALGVVVGLPYFAKAKARGCRVNCVNSVKQLGLALRMYSTDHGDEFPWKVSVSKGGSQEWALTPNVYQHFLAISNELNTPMILRCQDDRGTTRQTDWAALRNENISYFVCLDATESDPAQWLCGDRDVSTGSLLKSNLLTLQRTSAALWARGLHNGGGTLGLADGSAQQLNAAGLQLLLKSNSLSQIRLAIPYR